MDNTYTHGTIENRNIVDEMKESFIDYSMSVITSRALPDVRDGLKPVHRRILYSMYKTNMTPDRPECAGKLPSTRRRSRLRCDGASGAGFQHALSAGRWPGELWEHRRL